jgi:deoxyribodipyrimidine photo-lyase
LKKEEIVIVWLKRDLRLKDHEPIFFAQQQGLPILFIYCFEPSVMKYLDSDIRHWRFVYESLEDMQFQFARLNKKISVFHNEILFVFSEIEKHFKIKTIFSHEETGNRITYNRDISVRKFCSGNNIEWKEYQTNGIVRKLKSRKIWDSLWKKKMEEPPNFFELANCKFLDLNEEIYELVKGDELSKEITTRNPSFQPGGETYAWKYLDGFIKERHVNYSKHISKPALSRKGCSRLSPYLSYGNISIRMVHQYTMQHYALSPNKRALSNFISRLHWHCHFIQKFEDECLMEFENVNKAYDVLVKSKNEDFINAWQTGRTGVPIVDACMRCLLATGYINFRMRAMVVSFFVFNLWQDWRDLHYLAKMFLDYEPGIHYPQLQMQSGITGINTIRIYNPIKNSMEHDTDGIFIKNWIPELNRVPTTIIHEPWKMSALEQELYSVRIGINYPAPIVDIEETRKKASDIVWGFRKTEGVKKEGKRILAKHVNFSKAVKSKKR